MPKKCRSGKGQGRFKKRVRIDTDSPLAEDHARRMTPMSPSRSARVSCTSAAMCTCTPRGDRLLVGPNDTYSTSPSSCTAPDRGALSVQGLRPDEVKYTKGCEVEKLRSQIAVRRYLERAGDLKNLTETQIDELEERWNAAVAESRGLAMAKAKGVRVSQRSADGANAEEEKRAEVPEPEPTAEDAPKLSTTPPKRGPGRPKKKPRDALGRILRSTKGSSGFDDVIPARRRRRG